MSQPKAKPHHEPKKAPVAARSRQGPELTARRPLPYRNRVHHQQFRDLVGSQVGLLP